MADAVENLGPEGVKIAKREINKMLRARPRRSTGPALMSPATWWPLQNAERAEKKAARQAVKKAGHVLGTFGALFFKAAISGALKK